MSDEEKQRRARELLLRTLGAGAVPPAKEQGPAVPAAPSSSGSAAVGNKLLQALQQGQGLGPSIPPPTSTAAASATNTVAASALLKMLGAYCLYRSRSISISSHSKFPVNFLNARSDKAYSHPRSILLSIFLQAGQVLLLLSNQAAMGGLRQRVCRKGKCPTTSRKPKDKGQPRAKSSSRR